ncbi:MAG: deoxyribodipyrimidine photo-lyase, partial [Candidatus Omnitrophica bacterium]|nr:deoxyribodipyrimidine photo-lyase [Candidatus Omnitrophota bacterium]
MSDPKGPIIVWFRRDLRLRDNPALYWACKSDHPVLPIYVWSPEEEAPWEPGGASKWWLHHSLAALKKDLQEDNLDLVIAKGPSLETLKRVVKETGAVGLYWNRLYDPATLARDTEVKTYFKDQGLNVRSFNGSLLYEPWEIETKEGKPYQVFTPFWKAVRMDLDPAEPLPKPRKGMAEGFEHPSIDIDDLELLPKIDWAGGIQEAWEPGEDGARK